MGRRPFLVVAALVLGSTLPALASRDLMGGDEVRHADALRSLVEEGHAVVLRMNGEPYPDKPPGWFWLVAGLQTATGLATAPAFLLASALASLLLAFATWTTAKRVLRASDDVALAAAFVLLATPIFLVLARTTRMDALHAALLAYAAVQAYVGLSDARGRLATVGAALLGALATLVKGPFGLVALAAGVLLWLAWQGRLRRLLALDVLLGVVVAGMVVGAWLLAVRFTEGPEYLDRMLRDQLLGRLTGAPGIPGKQPAWFYLAALPAVLWPFPLVALAFPWGRLGATLLDRARLRAALGAWWARRRAAEGSGRSYLACLLVAGLVVLSASRSKFANYLLPLAVPASVLIGDRLLRLLDDGAQHVLAAVGGVTVVAGLALPFGNQWHPWPVEIAGLVPTAVALVATGMVVVDSAWRGASLRALGFLAAGAGTAALVLSLVTAPSLDPVLSPRAQAEVLAEAAGRGDRVLAYRVYPGTYAFHAGRRIPETDRLEDVEAFLAEAGPVAVATARKYYERHPETFRAMRVVHEQWIVERPYVVLARDGPEDGGSR